MTTPLADPGPPPAPPASAAPTSAAPARAPFGDRFFEWTAGLGVVRGDGWIGGVAAGIAARLRIDPLIVRGILVVIGLFGFPVLFLYAIAWALLPDLDGDIPLQYALRGVLLPAQLGIVAFAVLGLVPAPVPFLLGLPTMWTVAGSNGGLAAVLALAFIVGLAVVGGLVFLIVRAARSAPRATDPAVAPEQRTASADSATPDSSAAASGSGPDAAPADDEGADVAGFAASVPSTPTPVPGPGPGPDTDEYAAWREQHAAWKAQDDAWRRQQQDAARAARDQARRERHAHAAAFTAEAAERRRLRRLTAPRTPFAYVATVLGIAVVAGALVAVTSETELGGALGLFVAALLVALGMVVAGIVRRRSGFLAFMTLVLLAGGVAATAAPTLHAMHLGSYGISNAGPERWPASAPFVQPWGDLDITLRAADAPTEAIYVQKGSGGTTIWLDPDVTVHLDIRGAAWTTYTNTTVGESQDVIDLPSAVSSTTPDGGRRIVATLQASVGEGETVTDQSLVLDQQSGWIQIMRWDTAEDAR
ncbi:MAG: PspC domain-containing protein [Microbacterium sp.]|uniref:PspC domain-containing protein n=1 Tax=Microbacterium sp. TaxID=51671 RepID=UPI001AC4E2A5|nr:PspC domain-containing protein [Microbacterium sp.]MBN9178579.1 PspC domain-containing protein [Microbacterium sp.]